jgi:cobalt-precorrin-5B (C1)-methyltransferase
MKSDMDFGGMRSGYTTGSCAAAASKAAAVILQEDVMLNEIEITLPGGKKVVFPIKDIIKTENKVRVGIVKDAGDDPDITNGVTIWSEVEFKGKGIVIDGGEGIGRVTKPGLAVSVGKAAINPVPYNMIKSEVSKVLKINKDIKIVISVHEGEKLAKKTLNPKLGIKGGISILGTTGIVRPMSEEAYINSLLPQINQSTALGYDHIVFTPGGMGNRIAVNKGINPDLIVQTSNFIGKMLSGALQKNIKGIILFGHIGKLVKIAAGIFNTHSKIADARKETLAAYAALEGAPQRIIRSIMESNTAEEAVDIIINNKLDIVFGKLAEAISSRAMEYCSDELRIGTVIYSLKGEILGYDKNVLELGEVIGWKPE